MEEPRNSQDLSTPPQQGGAIGLIAKIFGGVTVLLLVGGAFMYFKAPAPPSNLRLSTDEVRSFAVSLAWDFSIDYYREVKGNEVQRCVDFTESTCTNWKTVGSPLSNYFLDKDGIVPNTEYRYRVRTQHKNGRWSNFSEIFETKTRALSTNAPENLRLRNAPGFFDLDGNTQLAAELTWDLPSGYHWWDSWEGDKSKDLEFQRCEGWNCSDWRVVGYEHASRPLHYDTGINAGGSYQYRARLKYKDGTYTEFSNTLSIQVPTSPAFIY